MKRIILLALILLTASCVINPISPDTGSINEKIKAELEQKLVSRKLIFSTEELSLSKGKTSLEGIGIANVYNKDLRFKIEITTLNCTNEGVELIFDEEEKVVPARDSLTMPLIIRTKQEGMCIFIIKAIETEYNYTYSTTGFSVLVN